MELLTVQEVAARLQVKVKTIYAWARQGKMPCVRLHGLVRFRREAIEQWLAAMEQPPSPRPSHSGIRRSQSLELDPVIAAAKRAVYTPRRGKTNARLRPIRREETDGVV